MSKSVSKKIYGNFVVTRLSEIEEIQTTLIELEHLPTGAQIIKLLNGDQENLFNLSFRTWPTSSNGVAHILEHIILCGSENFPVRDPFFSMHRRSLNTFMNALTGGDFTCYPAASQIEKDFFNLLRVYLDAVFKPKLTKLSFLQEGHRIEFSHPNDVNSPLLFKGIVYNEMKGAMATGEARLGESLMEALFPDLTYHFNSGGDPKIIPSLTYEELKAFHTKFYHPSRCLFYFYGNISLEKHLEFLEKYAFKGVKKTPSLPPLPKQPRFQKSIKKTLTYPISEAEETTDKMLLGFSWLTCGILDQLELLALCTLDIILMGSDAAPLKAALLKSNLCKQASSMMSTEMSEIPFTIICKGCHVENGELIEQIISSTLQSLIKTEISNQLIDGAIHQIEMTRMEITGGSSPYGLDLYFRSALLKQHGGDPADGLQIHTLFTHLREKVKHPSYLPELIKKHFLFNPHHVRITMIPEPNLATQEMQEEQNRLNKIYDSLKKEQISAILEQTKNLEKAQEESENLHLLPKITLDDVARYGKEFFLESEKIGQFDLHYHPCFTNDILYADLFLDLPEIVENDLPLLRLFSVILPEVGCGKNSYREHLEFLLEHTGGIHVSLDLGIQGDESEKLRPSLIISGKALYRKIDKFFSIFGEILTKANFKDIPRIQDLLTQHFLEVENSIQHHPLRYAIHLASRGSSVPSTIANAWYGIDYYYALKNIMELFHRDPGLLIEKLERLQNLCLNLSGGDLVLTCSEEMVKKLKKEQFYGLSKIPSRPSSQWKENYLIKPTKSQGRMISSPVAFTTLFLKSLYYTHPHAPALSLASEIMENKILHKRIREQGGAYGAGAVNKTLLQQFYFYSYRDPHLKKSIDAFHEATHMVVSGKFETSDIEEAKLVLFQELDAPIPPGERAVTAYSHLRGNRSPKVRQLFRERLLKLSKKEITLAIRDHIAVNLKEGIIVSFASKNLLEKENSLLEHPLDLYKI
ncbi:MAG: insulinase family protein [Chlamydiales bacterium]